jgi:hypothetical protein
MKEYCIVQPIVKVKNYLNNKDILKEIHKSKSTYCVFLDPSYADYDMILPSVDKINKKNIMQARKDRAERLTKLAFDEANVDGVAKANKKKLEDFEVKLKDVPAEDVVFRIMTWEHIPPAAPKVKKGAAIVIEETEDDEVLTEYDDPDLVKAPTKYTKCNFPPFFHYKVTEDGTPYVVGKSHWKGDIITGEFSKDHGQMTKKLAHMFMKLCERYATRSNWRGYTYNDEMRSQALLQLSQIGLQFDESKSQNPFAYYTAAITNSFTRVLNIEKRNQNLRDDILEMNGLTPSYTRQGQGSWGGGGASSGDFVEE